MLFEFKGKDFELKLEATGDEFSMVCNSLPGLLGNNLGLQNPLNNCMPLLENRILPYCQGDGWGGDWLDGDGVAEEGENDRLEISEDRIVELEMSKEEMLFVLLCYRYGLLERPAEEEVELDF